MSEPIIKIELKDEIPDIPFFVIITKPNKHKIQTKLITETAKDLDSIKSKILYIMQEELSLINNLPTEYSYFVPVWYETISADADPFDYKIFINGKWSTPWNIEDLYEETYEILHKLELLSGYINVENQAESDDEENENIE
jgi:hypothetical protein